jgi:hypothetical protein
MGPQNRGSPNLGNFGTPIWDSQDQNAIWIWASWRGTKYIYKGESGGFPQVRAVVNLVSSRLPVTRHSIKSAQIMH